MSSDDPGSPYINGKKSHLSDLLQEFTAYDVICLQEVDETNIKLLMGVPTKPSETGTVPNGHLKDYTFFWHEKSRNAILIKNSDKYTISKINDVKLQDNKVGKSATLFPNKKILDDSYLLQRVLLVPTDVSNTNGCITIGNTHLKAGDKFDAIEQRLWQYILIILYMYGPATFDVSVSKGPPISYVPLAIFLCGDFNAGRVQTQQDAAGQSKIAGVPLSMGKRTSVPTKKAQQESNREINSRTKFFNEFKQSAEGFLQTVDLFDLPYYAKLVSGYPGQIQDPLMRDVKLKLQNSVTNFDKDPEKESKRMFQIMRSKFSQGNTGRSKAGLLDRIFCQDTFPKDGHEFIASAPDLSDDTKHVFKLEELSMLVSDHTPQWVKAKIWMDGIETRASFTPRKNPDVLNLNTKKPYEFLNSTIIISPELEQNLKASQEIKILGNNLSLMEDGISLSKADLPIQVKKIFEKEIEIGVVQNPDFFKGTFEESKVAQNPFFNNTFEESKVAQNPFTFVYKEVIGNNQNSISNELPTISPKKITGDVKFIKQNDHYSTNKQVRKNRSDLEAFKRTNFLTQNRNNSKKRSFTKAFKTSSDFLEPTRKTLKI